MLHDRLRFDVEQVVVRDGIRQPDDVSGESETIGPAFGAGVRSDVAHKRIVCGRGRPEPELTWEINRIADEHGSMGHAEPGLVTR
jgi:hypothetical protein